MVLGIQGEQVAQTVDLFDRQRLVDGMAGHRQRDERDEVHRVDGRNGVDAGECFDGEGSHDGVLPGVSLLVHELAQLYRRREIEGDLAERLADEPQALYDAANRFPGLCLAPQFLQVSPGFDQLFVADVDGHDGDGTPHAAPVAANGHAQHAGARMEQASGPGTSALDEVLHRVSAPEHLVEVLGEHRRVERVIGETAAHEEGAAAAEQRPDDRHVQVLAGGDVRRHQAGVEQRIRQQQEVDVRAVARCVHECMCLGDIIESIEPPDLDAGIDAMPEPGEESIEKPEAGIGQVGSDFVGVVAGQPRRGVLLFAFFNDRPNGFAPEDPGYQAAPVRQVGTQGCRALVAEFHAYQARRSAREPVGVHARVDDVVPQYGARELHQDVGAIEEQAHESAES